MLKFLGTPIWASDHTYTGGEKATCLCDNPQMPQARTTQLGLVKSPMRVLKPTLEHQAAA